MGARRVASLIGLGSLCLAPACKGGDSAKGLAPRAACLAVPTAIDPNSRGGLVWIPGGRTTIGSDHFQPEERPVRTVAVAGFWIDRHEVTNAEFAAFVRATGYRTRAERDHQPGGAVFAPPARVDVNGDYRQWWRFDPTASWRVPHGQGGVRSSAEMPVVQVTEEDALAYARWRGRDLPTEVEWERAARGGLANADYTWGAKQRNGKPRANYWQGVFPVVDTASDGFHGIAPVGCFPPNGYGLYDMAGNVWELTKTQWERGGLAAAYVIKGGSWLCADNYCLRYRPAARQPGESDLGTDHIGFRTVLRAPGPDPSRPWQ